ncbi:MAG TPA: rhodanese-like domain-containing protein [Planctomycetota bacterium]|nr:rhodanese-like domain-containing protein [Planctomycetota bacterium]
MQTMSLDELRQWRRQKKDFLLLDVLDDSQFQQGHVPGSRSAPVALPDFEQQVARQAGRKDRPVVVYCASMTCDASTRAARRLEDAGFTDVHDFKGGMKTWQEAGEAVESLNQAGSGG